MMRFPRARILVLAKAPVPGQCKTRLIPMLGPSGAARLAERLLEQTLQEATVAGEAPVDLWCAPDAGHALFQCLATRYEVNLTSQRGADLGARMLAAIRATFAQGTERLVLIGTDCPALGAPYLAGALGALTSARVVIGPADDGGYVLIGMRRDALPAAEALFASMPWGGPQVAALTRGRLASVGLRWAELPSLADLDRPEDLNHCIAQGLLAGLDPQTLGLDCV